jgi:uncharacterized membrane protein (UPF0127 family)
MKKLVITATLLLLISLMGCQQSPQVEIGDKAVVFVEIADDLEERRTGLMHREHLAENAGMLFIYETERELSFWMKNTLIPLDIIYINSAFEIVDIKHALPCQADPCPTYLSKAPAQYVLEVNAGFSAEKGLLEGDKIEFHLN